MKPFSMAKLEKTLGGLKLAVTLIILFALMMTVGTFLESYFGTEFANRTVYKTWFFMLIQFFMFISICYATFLRLPPKKRLYGFYVLHTGLILLGCGSFITWYAGIDGQISLVPNDPSRAVILSDDIVKISWSENQKIATKVLPNTAFKKELNLHYEGVFLKTYYPYAENILYWLPSEKKESFAHSSQYQIYNDNVAQKFILSLHPDVQDFQSTLSLGPLSLNYLPGPLADCFALKNNMSKLIFWNHIDQSCFTPEAKGLSIQKTESGQRFLVLPFENEILSFFPDKSPWPYGKDFKVMQGSPIRIFSKNLFEKKPYLFLFGNKIAYFNQDLDSPQWSVHSIATGQEVELPWMGFKLLLLKHTESTYPAYRPRYTTPIQKNNQIVKGSLRALKLSVLDKEYWVTNERPLNLLVQGQRLRIELTKKSLTLPFEFVLENFKMDTDPGTNNPASYESFVKLFTSDGHSKHHIFMNNPLKHEGFTFYQASYFRDPNTGQFGSTLSANVDQGRGLKYAGSLLLVLGSIGHFLLNRKKIKKDQHV